MGEKVVRITRKQIKAIAKSFPDLYEVREDEHGFEVKSHGALRTYTVFFWNDGTAMRTDFPSYPTHWITIQEGARMLGITPRGPLVFCG